MRVFSEKNGFRVLGVFPTSGLFGVAAYFILLRVVENVARGNHVIQFMLRPFFGFMALVGILMDELFRNETASLGYIAVLASCGEVPAGSETGP